MEAAGQAVTGLFVYWGFRARQHLRSLCAHLSVCLSKFLSSSEKTVRAIGAQFSGCIDPLGGCLLLHVFGVHGASGTRCKAPPENGLHAPAGQMLRCRISKLCEKTDTAVGWVLFVAAAVWGAQDAHTWH